MPKPLKVVLTGGGTGGHLMPALALADALTAHYADTPDQLTLTFIGNPTSMEATKVPQAGYAFEGVSFYGLPRKRNGVAQLKWILALVRATYQADRLLGKLRPNVVVGTGGYVSAPVVLAAKRRGIPLLVHEPDATPGLVNKLMAPLATQVTGAFAQAQQALRTRHFEVTGNPLRGFSGQALPHAEAQAQLGVDWPEDRPVLVVIGGSQGARQLNHAVVQALPTLINELGLAVIHQTGDALYEETLAALPPELADSPYYKVMPFYPAMQAVWSLASVAVCRAGSLTLSELWAYGVPAVLVPYPHAAANHQHHNAVAVVQAGAATLLPDAECSGKGLLASLRPLLGDEAKLHAMREVALGLAKPHATQAILAHVLRLAK
jgi:UDP-N-acetylglucosamine--N-acetylmuramyl-(pentapeptide) pyrophosphoryl-undecaprenol N-acetylglucosamine transferase